MSEETEAMQEESRIVQVESDNSEMVAAIVEAKRTVGQFLVASKKETIH